MSNTARKKPEPCYVIEGEWANDTEEENERTMGREVPSSED
jgi:hypothetical protein